MQLTKARQRQVAKILDTLYAQGPMSRIDLSKYLGITPATITDLTQVMIDEKILYELGEEDSNNGRAGRRKILLDICPDHSYFLGAELFEKSIILCLSDNKGKAIEKEEHHFSCIKEKNVIKHLKAFLEKHKDKKIKAIGVAIPGHYDRNSPEILTNNPFWKNFSLKKIKEAISIPIYFENNVNTMAIYERLFGQFKTDPNFLFMHFRRGMFSSYLYHQKIYARNNFYVGEIGHMVMNPHGTLCECGKHGCLQTYASQTWMIKKAKILYQSETNTYLKTLVKDEEEIDIQIILQAYHLGDSAIVHMIETAINYIAIAINNILVSLDANIVYLHAELFNDQSIAWLLLKQIEHHDSKLLPRDDIEMIIKPYAKENGAIAACALALQESMLRS